MTAQEDKILRIQLCHPCMGVHNFDINSRDNFTELRVLLSQHTPMTIFENYRFEVNGKILPQFQQIGQAIHNQARINLTIQPFNQKTSYYHLQRVKEILANPIQWAMLNNRQSSQQKQFPIQKLPQNITIDNFLQSQLTSPLYQSHSEPSQHLTFLQQLNFSIHNPPPMHRKLAGDFYYLQIKTLQGHEEHVTANPLGFYVNNSSNSCFNTTKTDNRYFYNLLDLFKYLSPRFKQNFNNIKKIYKTTDLDKAIFSSYKGAPQCDWLKNTNQNSHKKNKTNQWRYCYYENLTDNNTTIKDWNQILQINSIIHSDSQVDILNKQKNKYKLNQDFINFAKQAAVKVVQSQITPIKFQNNFTNRKFVYGSLLLWFVQDNPLSYTLYENHKLTKNAINAELRNFQLLQNSKNFNINFQHTVLVNYKGYDVVVQTIIPGTMDKSYNLKKPQNKRIDQKAIQQIAKFLKIQTKNLYRDKNNQIQKAIVHPQILGIVADDKRSYILNLYSFSIRDLNFPSSQNNACYLKRQLIQIYNQKQLCYRNTNAMIDSGYNLIPNERVSQQHMKLNSLKRFAQQIMVPLCIQSFLKENKKNLADSKSVIKIMHQFGLSSRYLGFLYKKAIQYQAPHIKIIIERVILVKILQSLFRQALRKSELGDVKATICKLLNCIFFSETVQIYWSQSLAKDDLKDQISTNASRKKKKKIEVTSQNMQDQINIRISSQAIGQMKPSDLWQQIKQVGLFKYGMKWSQTKISMLKCLQNQFSKYAMLRDLCINIGIIVQKNQYFHKQGLIFKVEHIQQLRPITKAILFKNKYFEGLIKQGDLLIDRKKVEQAIDIYNQAINYATSNFGIVTPQLALLNKKIAQIYFRIDEIDAALLFVHCAQKMCEKIYGVSHVETIECYNLLSQFNFYYRNFQVAEFYLIKAIHISTLSFGEQYPQLIIAYLNLSSIYEANARYMDSISCIGHALRIVLIIFGENSINAGICYAAMSTAHFQIPDIEKSIFFQQKSIQILKNIVRPDDERIKQAMKILQIYYHIQSTKKVKEMFQKQKKKLMANQQQLYAGYPLFRLPEYSQYNAKDREFLCRKMQNFMQLPGKFYI